MVPVWRDYANRLERDLLPDPRFDFLRHPILLETMQIRGRRSLAGALRNLEARLDPESLSELLDEDLVGVPALDCRRYSTSHTLVHHLYHLERFAASTGVDWRRIGGVVELGGGYGSLARLMRRGAERPPTHVIIDMPVPALLTWLFLGAIFGASNVDLLRSPGTPKPGQITIVPAALASSIDLTGELFVSTWGLSEISRPAQERIAAGAWFGAEHLLLAFQRSTKDFPDAVVTEALVRNAGAAIEPVNVIGGSSYGFR